MHGSFHFSIAKGGEPLLDRIGSATDRHFRVVLLCDPLKFMIGDLHENTPFEWQGWVLSQNSTGVPIGAYLSTQLMCIWALIQEINFMESPSRVFERVLVNWDRKVLLSIALKPGLVLTFLAAAWVPRDTQLFNASGMQGWFEPSWKHVGSLCVDGVSVELRALVLWDSHPEGMLATLSRARCGVNIFSCGY